ncbi:hypothetical protein [Catenulispora yoronensis]|uniref:hypothetical protein n=1 Tax=Catenulispora yoronensis TaxID=450799 RepID=UPI0031E49515
MATNDLVSPSEEPEESDELDASAGAEDEADAASVLDEDPAADGEPVSVVAGAEPEAEPLAEPLTVLVLFAAGVVAVPPAADVPCDAHAAAASATAPATSSEIPVVRERCACLDIVRPP